MFWCVSGKESLLATKEGVSTKESKKRGVSAQGPVNKATSIAFIP